MSEDPLAFDVGLNFYYYANANPTNLTDPTGLYGIGDILRAHSHYCDGSGTPWSTTFSSINWGNTTEAQLAKVRAMVGGSCKERTIPVTFQSEGQTAGADEYIVGEHNVKVAGEIQVHCNCTWSFEGNMSSASGADRYNFNAGHRGWLKELEGLFGKNSCKGVPFDIKIIGSLGLSAAGKISGRPTCGCGQ